MQAELKSDTYFDFKKYVLQLENDAQGFLRLPLSEWKWAQGRVIVVNFFAFGQWLSWVVARECP